MVVFDEKKFNFTDSLINKVELDSNLCDYLIVIDYYQGKYESKTLTVRLKNVKKFVFHKEYIEKDNFTPLTIAHIAKRTIKNDTQIVIESVLSYLPGHEDDKPLIDCICENAFIEY
ncbi:MAG: hypothetical protein K2L67_04365 [Clostridia bacterium]|nr:hypothetical protein [Clostridia bacterium]